MAVDDGADDGRGDGLRPGGQGRRRLGGDQQHAPGRRLARDRDHGRDRGHERRRPADGMPTRGRPVAGVRRRLSPAARASLGGARLRLVAAIISVRRRVHAAKPGLTADEQGRQAAVRSGRARTMGSRARPPEMKPPAAAPGVVSVRRLRLVWRSSPGLGSAAQPRSSGPSPILVKRPLQPTLASGSMQVA